MSESIGGHHPNVSIALCYNEKKRYRLMSVHHSRVFGKKGATMSKLSMIEGIGETYELKLKEAGIGSVEALVAFCAHKKGRDALALKTGIGEKLILKWTNHGDLFRIKGIAGQYAELLEASGVDTVIELATRKPENLAAKLLEINAAKKLVRQVPSVKQVEDWVAQAGKLPRAVFY
jgi:predicted flap endonuclease-1-like 5' DNA nuclease